MGRFRQRDDDFVNLMPIDQRRQFIGAAQHRTALHRGVIAVLCDKPDDLIPQVGRALDLVQHQLADVARADDQGPIAPDAALCSRTCTARYSQRPTVTSKIVKTQA